MFRIGLKTVVLVLLVSWVGGMGAAWPSAQAVGVPGSAVPESPDFATLVLRDPWDMQQYTDVSQYLNQSGQQLQVVNPAVASGEFTGQSAGYLGDSNPHLANASFFPLFPGYDTAMLVGKVGHRYPINSSVYQCLYIAMKVAAAQAPRHSPDEFNVFWFADQTLNSAPNKWGEAVGIPLYYPDPGPTPVNYRLYKVNLTSPPTQHTGAAWTSRSTWEGLRIDPTLNAGVNFAVDWVRLTTCQPNNQFITWSPNSSITTAWVQPVGTGRWIRVASGLNGSNGSANIDVEGIQPGSYLVGVGNTSGVLQQSTASLVIQATPIADFVSPSYFSGQDYASQAGLPWDFNSSKDVASAANISYSIHDSVLDTTIPSGVADPQIFLNTPQPIAPAHYRYLSFRMFTSWTAPWQNVPDGMIARAVWGIKGVSGAPTNRCWLVSHDIPFDIGWQTYWIDLGDSFNGAPLQSSVVDCPSSLPSWTGSPQVLNFRFDPSENITAASDPITNGGPFHQEIDWIRLTAIDSVARGTPYRVQLHLSRDITQISYYYTTNPSSPTQSAARPLAADTPASGSFRLFLPLVLNSLGNADMGGLPVVNEAFTWDTSGVSPNTYYICVRVTGGGSTATYCSEAPVIVH